MTLEEAKMKILELEEELSSEKKIIETHVENNKILSEKVTQLQEYNQKLFLKATKSFETNNSVREDDENPIEKFIETVTI